MKRAHFMSTVTQHHWEVHALGERMFHIFGGILAVLSDSEDRGQISLTDPDLGSRWLASRINRDHAEMMDAIRVFKKMGVLGVSEDGFLFYQQMLDDNFTRERAKFRKRKSRGVNDSPDVTDTSRECHSDVTAMSRGVKESKVKEEILNQKDTRAEAPEPAPPEPAPKAPDVAAPKKRVAKSEAATSRLSKFDSVEYFKDAWEPILAAARAASPTKFHDTQRVRDKLRITMVELVELDGVEPYVVCKVLHWFLAHSQTVAAARWWWEKDLAVPGPSLRDRNKDGVSRFDQWRRLWEVATKDVRATPPPPPKSLYEKCLDVPMIPLGCPETTFLEFVTLRMTFNGRTEEEALDDLRKAVEAMIWSKDIGRKDLKVADFVAAVERWVETPEATIQ